MCDTYMRVNENVRQVQQQWRLACFSLFTPPPPQVVMLFICASASVKQHLHEHQVNNIKTITFLLRSQSNLKSVQEEKKTRLKNIFCLFVLFVVGVGAPVVVIRSEVTRTPSFHNFLYT